MAYIPILACIGIGIALIYGAYTDYQERIIQNRIPLSIFFFGFFTATSLSNKILSLALIIVILIAISSLTGSKSGGGDIKTYLALSFATGLQMTGIILLVTILLAHIAIHFDKTGKIKKDGRIPLCTFLAPAYLIVFIGTMTFSTVFAR